MARHKKDKEKKEPFDGFTFPSCWDDMNFERAEFFPDADEALEKKYREYLKLRDRITKPIKLIILDVDGVLTDGGIYVDADGRELYKAFNVKDGLGITLAKQVGIATAIITGKESSIVAHRAAALGIELVYQGNLDKRAAYADIKEKTGLRDEEIAYIGDDVLDLPIMTQVGFPMAVADAVEEVLDIAEFVAPEVGGHGAVRICYEEILRAQGKWDKIIGDLSDTKLNQ